MIFLGGSLVSSDLSIFVEMIKQNSDLPVMLFPGSVFQITQNADAILLLSLISGRNPDYLIGNHVIAAPILKKSSLEIGPPPIRNRQKKIQKLNPLPEAFRERCKACSKQCMEVPGSYRRWARRTWLTSAKIRS